MASSPLQRAIARGMKPDGNLVDELNGLGDYSIRSRADAKAICRALDTLPCQPARVQDTTSPLFALTALFQQVEGRDTPAFEVLRDEGVARLVRIFDMKIGDVNKKEAEDLLFTLKILAMYGSREGADRIIMAARRPLRPEDYLWHGILSAVSKDHRLRDYVLDALRDPLPPASLAVALLESANEAAIAGDLRRHPFDHQEGWQQLQSWLADDNPEEFGYAHSATAALPFLTNPPRDQLLALAMDHMSPRVQIEAAWAAAKLGREGGLSLLARSCLDVNTSGVARRYLAELNREDFIPAAANDPSFQAKAEFAEWLAHPCELGLPPDELEIVDHRMLAWPPQRESMPFWVIRYRLRDKTGLHEDAVGCGLVGSMTWCCFSYDMHARPPEDVYAIHCSLEMEHAGLVEYIEVTDPAEYAGMLAQWHGAPLDEPRVTLVAELSPKLDTFGRLLALASARLNDKEGWVVLDGPRSTWYSKAEQPKNSDEGVVLAIHVGRQLLGFHDQPDRKAYLVPKASPREPRKVIAAYEKLLTEAAHAEPWRQKELLGSSGVLGGNFGAYVEALTAVHGISKSSAVIDVYERLLRIAASAEQSIAGETYDAMGVLGRNFESYVDALVASGRSAEVPGLIELFVPFWDHNLGYGQLGNAAFKAGHREIAEHFLVKLRQGMKSYYLSTEEMSRLAELWRDRGEAEQASALLIGCMRTLIAEISAAKYESDRVRFAKDLQFYRSTYLRIFPESERQLAELGIPAELL